MAATTDVKTLLLEVDASVELLRRNLMQGDRAVAQFQQDTQRRMDQTDQRFDRLGRGLTSIGPSIAATRAQIATIGTSVERVERQVRASSGAMRTALLASTSAIASALSAREVAQLADGYTRFTNQLKLAGLEGRALGQTQEDLYGIAQKYGVQLEAVGSLFGRLSQGAKELGANQQDLLRFTNGVGAALKVQGGDASASAGALLQLSQALGGAVVRAEEFNSINEGARPILQAVANGIDRFGGSVSKLRAEVVDGKVTSKEFFQGFLAGSKDLEAQAARANLTIGASFTILNNALGKYIGQADQSLSVTEKISGAIVSLANNLNLVAPALAAIGVGFAARFAVGPVTKAVAEVLLLKQALEANRVVMGTVAVAEAQRAQAGAAAAAADLAGIEATIAARQAEQVQLRQQIVAERALAAERKAQAAQAAASNVNGTAGRTAALRAQARFENDATFATQRLAAARQRLAVVDGELAVAEGTLAGAQARSAAATDIATAAAARATLAARAGAVASRLFAGALTLIGGSVAGGAAVLAIGALVGAVLLLRSETRDTGAELARFEENGRSLNQKLRELATTGAAAAGGVNQVGRAAATNTAAVRAFAGAVGDAAQKLYDLAKARRHEQVLGFTTEKVAADQDEANARARIDDRRRRYGGSRFALMSSSDIADEKNDYRILFEAQRRSSTAYQAAQRAASIPLETRVRETDRPGGRDVAGDRARIQRDLAIARQGGDKAQIRELQAQGFEVSQYAKYRKDGLSVEEANRQSAADAGKFRAAGESKADRTAGAKADREAAAAQRRSAAAARDAAGDARAYAAAERQANGEIAAARAELTGSAVERAQIERDRITAERDSRAEEIEAQRKQGRFGDGATGGKRASGLTALNAQRAQLELDVVDAREKQRLAGEAAAIASADRENRRDLLQAQSDLTTTTGERRVIELQLLDLQYEEQKARLDAVVASRETTEAEKEIARRRLASLGELKSADQKRVEQQTASPIERYRDDLLASTADMKAALEDVEVNGLRGLEDGLVDVISGTRSLGSSFRAMANGIIADLARIAIRKAIMSSVRSIGLGFADGGVVPKFATGGIITGPGTGTSDSIIARVSAGEGILTADTLRHYGAGIVGALNDKRLPRFANGGVVGGGSIPSLRSPRVPDLRGSGAGSQRLALTGKIEVEPSPLLLATVRETSAQMIGAAAEPIMAGAEGRTMQRIQRPTLPGGLAG